MNDLNILPIFLLIFVVSTKSANILIVFPMKMKSHHILGSGIGKVLAEAGHNVTMVSPFEETNRPQNGSWTDVVIKRAEGPVNDNFFKFMHQNMFINVVLLGEIGNRLSRRTLNDSGVQELLKSDQKFDVVIVEEFLCDALKVFAAHFKAPLILFSTFGANRWINSFVANPAPPSYIPYTSTSFSSRMSFYQRFMNMLISIVIDINRYGIYLTQQNKILKEFLPDSPNVHDFVYNVSLVFLNSHVSATQPKPHVPAMVEIGGFHIQPPKKLPPDLQEYLDGAKEGVVYFSMGTNVKLNMIPQNLKNIILKSFSKLEQKVLCKWEEDIPVNKYKNIKFVKWMPQNDILAHPNVKLFITHGGLLSILETIHHGKPILPLPVFADQKMNAADAVESGFALSISFDDLTEDKLINTINELINNTK